MITSLYEANSKYQCWQQETLHSNYFSGAWRFIPHSNNNQLEMCFLSVFATSEKKELGTLGYLHYLKIKIIVKEISWGGRGSLAKAPLIAISMDGFSKSVCQL